MYKFFEVNSRVLSLIRASYSRSGQSAPVDQYVKELQRPLNSSPYPVNPKTENLGAPFANRSNTPNSGMYGGVSPVRRIPMPVTRVHLIPYSRERRIGLYWQQSHSNPMQAPMALERRLMILGMPALEHRLILLMRIRGTLGILASIPLREQR